MQRVNYVAKVTKTTLSEEKKSIIKQNQFLNSVNYYS